MDQGILLFRNAHPDSNFIEKIFAYDVNKLEATSGEEISRYNIALSQWLVYYKSQINQTRVDMLKKQRTLDGVMSYRLTKEILKEYKTKTAATEHIIKSDQELNKMQEDIFNIKDELLLIEGIDKTVHELIAAFKRELTRRENELYSVRKERYS